MGWNQLVLKFNLITAILKSYLKVTLSISFPLAMVLTFLLKKVIAFNLPNKHNEYTHITGFWSRKSSII